MHIDQLKFIEVDKSDKILIVDRYQYSKYVINLYITQVNLSKWTAFLTAFYIYQNWIQTY